jgi:hypothetical protein
MTSPICQRCGFTKPRTPVRFATVIWRVQPGQATHRPCRPATRTKVLLSPRGCGWMTSGVQGSQHWIWITLTALALAVIGFLAMPAPVIKQATDC